MKGVAGVGGQWRRRRDGHRRCLTPPAPPNLPRHLPTAHRDGRWGDRRANGTWGGESPATRLGGGVQGPVLRARTPRGLFVVDTSHLGALGGGDLPVDWSTHPTEPSSPTGKLTLRVQSRNLLEPLLNSVRQPNARRHRLHYFPPVTHLVPKPRIGATLRCAMTAVTHPPSPRKRWRDPRRDSERRAQRPSCRASRPRPSTRRVRVARSVRRRAPGGVRARRTGGGSSGAQCGTAHNEWAPSPQPVPRAPIPAAATASPCAGLAGWCGVAPQRPPRPPSAPAPSYPRSMPATHPPLLLYHREAPTEKALPPTPPRATPSCPRPDFLV